MFVCEVCLIMHAEEGLLFLAQITRKRKRGEREWAEREAERKNERKKRKKERKVYF